MARVALVLAGGGARGAYEVGVLKYVVEHVARDLDGPVHFDVVSGTSVGAINAAMLASFADDPRIGVERLIKAWTSLSMDGVVRTDRRRLWGLVRGLFPGSSAAMQRSAVFGAEGLRHMLELAIPFERIDQMIARGHLAAVSITATHIASGRTVVFVQRGEPGLPAWGSDGTVVARPARLRVEHALASAAIPLVFPEVSIDGELYCDGGLRQNVPLSPARRLGATDLLVISPRHLPELPAPPAIAHGASPGPLFLLGKALNALLLDRIDEDVERLERINAYLEAGERRYGPSFVDDINRELGFLGKRRLRKLTTVLVRPSEDLSRIGADFVRQGAFKTQPSGVLGRLIAGIANGDLGNEADLLSYLLFDGAFAARLIELGERDARARHDELCAFFSRVQSAHSPSERQIWPLAKPT